MRSVQFWNLLNMFFFDQLHHIISCCDVMCTAIFRDHTEVAKYIVESNLVIQKAFGTNLLILYQNERNPINSFNARFSLTYFRQYSYLIPAEKIEIPPVPWCFRKGDHKFLCIFRWIGIKGKVGLRWVNVPTESSTKLVSIFPNKNEAKDLEMGYGKLLSSLL